MKLRLAPRALSEAKRKKTWWKKNRQASPDLFEEEFNVTVRSIQSTPSVGAVYPSRFDIVIRRVLMTRTKNHVYFTVTDAEVVILSVWGAARERGPKL
jgi:plasmid stabilization system protein ParE